MKASPIENATNQPTVSVVIASVNGLPILAECIENLVCQKAERAAEVLIIDRCGEETRSVIRDRFPQVRVIEATGQPSIPSLRAAGIGLSTGRYVAIIEDHCLAEPGWLRAIEKACQDGREAIGGPVENGSTDRVVDWAVFFCEYTRFMGPVPRGEVPEIPGNNSAYDRRVFDRLGAELRAEVWESFLQARMRELGVAFYSIPEMVVRHKKEFGYVYFLIQRFHYSRSFAGMRMAGAPLWKRLTYAAATGLLPPVLLGRTTAAVWRKRRHIGWYLLCLPVFMTFLVSWAVGEAVGAVFGPGRSLERVE